MAQKASKEELETFVNSWSLWHKNEVLQVFEAWSKSDQCLRTFTENQLSAIDPRILTVLSSPLRADDEPTDLGLKLRNSVFIWNHPERKIIDKVQPIYWQDMVSIESTDSTKVEIMFAAPREVYMHKDGTFIATGKQDMPCVTKSWTEWDKMFPGIQKYHDVAILMDMDEYEVAEYCQEMLFDNKGVTPEPSTIVPNDIL